MTEEFYWVLYGDEDGGNCLKYTKEELAQELNDEEEGWLKGFLVDLPKSQYGNGSETSMAYWPGDPQGSRSGILIIKGSVVVPKEIKKVTEWTVE